MQYVRPNNSGAMLRHLKHCHLCTNIKRSFKDTIHLGSIQACPISWFYVLSFFTGGPPSTGWKYSTSIGGTSLVKREDNKWCKIIKSRNSFLNFFHFFVLEVPPAGWSKAIQVLSLLLNWSHLGKVALQFFKIVCYLQTNSGIFAKAVLKKE